MRAALAGEVLAEAEGLVAELKAIEQWDVGYWRNPSPEAYETLAFVARAQRRGEILSQLLSVLSTHLATGSEEIVNSQENAASTGTVNRRHPRLEFEAELIVRSESGFVPGRTEDISESGMCAILAVQLGVGATVALKIRLPIALATTRAVVRNRNVFRHGFEFLRPLCDVIGHEVASDGCQSCGGTGLILQALAVVQGVGWARVWCPYCGGVGRSA